MQSIVSTQLFKDANFVSPKGEVVIQAPSREILSRRLHIYPRQVVFDFVFINNPNSSDLIKLSHRYQLYVTHIDWSVAPYPLLRREKPPQPLLTCRLGIRTRNIVLLKERNCATHTSEIT